MRLPPGFCFHPTDVELVNYYLKRKLLGKRIAFDAIAELDIYKYAPWDLPGKSRFDGGDRKCYFFCSVNKYGRGVKSDRSTEFGYWKSTGKDRPVGGGDCVAGMVKTLVFHLGGERTDWVMHEYRIEEEELRDCGAAAARDGYVLCAVFKKDGLETRVGEAAPACLMHSIDVRNCLNSNLNASDNLDVWCVEPHPSEPDDSLPICTPSGYDVDLDLPQSAHEDDDILSMLAMFGEENASYPGNELIQVEDRINCRNACTNSASDGVDICFGFEDRENIGPMTDSVYNISGPCSANDSMDQQHYEADFLELMDLDVPLSCSKEAAQDETLEADSFVDFNNYGNDTEQPCYLHGADATFAASFNGSATVCDQNGGKKVNLACTITDSATLKLQEGNAHVQKSFSRGDHAHSIIFLKKLKDGVMFCHCDGSSTHVKAEVTRTGALKTLCQISWRSLEVEFGKGIASSNTDFMLMFVRFCIIATPHFVMLQESLLIIWFICDVSCACIFHVMSATFHHIDEFASFGLTVLFFFCLLLSFLSLFSVARRYNVRSLSQKA